jgi:hypothetical protein
MGNIKEQTFGGARICNTSPHVPLGRGVERKESKMYNIVLDFEGVLRMQHSFSEAASYLSAFKEQSAEHKDGVRLVINFETSRVDVQKP